ncbi:hypothetical protein [Marinomonas sp. THO17]|uniref:hypothetical protein n=1 Tax=Marinomonas sp. THO17 TaxID=3149048 RepID=UPI00336BD5C3
MYDQASNSNLIMLLHTAVYPFFAALIISFIAGKLSRSMSFLGYLGGFLVGLGLIHSGLSFPPKQAMDYYTISAILGILTYLSLSRIQFSSVLKYSISLILAALSFYALLNPVLKHSGMPISLSWSLASAVLVVVYLMLSHLASSKQDEAKSGIEKLQPHLPMIGLMIVAGSAAPVISIGGSLLIGQLLGAFAAASFAYLLITLLLSKHQEFSNAAGIIILAGLITQSHVLADIPLSVMFLIGASCFVTPIVNGLTHKTIPSILCQAIISMAISGFCLWLVWPESSLY